MNPLMRFLFTSVYPFLPGDPYDGSKTSDFANLTQELRRLKEGRGDIPEAFKAIKDAHKDASPQARINEAFGLFPNASEPVLAGDSTPSPLDDAQWPFGPNGAPSQAYAAAPAATAVPLPRPRPEAAPAVPEPDPMSAFQRNAYLQRDPVTGDYLSPDMAAKANASPWKGLFG